MNKKNLTGLMGLLTIALLCTSLAGSGGWAPHRRAAQGAADDDLVTRSGPQASAGIVLQDSWRSSNRADEVILTAPFEYVDNGTFFDVDPVERNNWNARSFADATGRCRLNVSAVNVSAFGSAGAYAVIGGITTAAASYEKPVAEFYFSAQFTIFDDVFVAGKSQVRVLYFYFEDDDVLGTGELAAWVEYTEGKAYTIDYTETPLMLALDEYGYTAGKTYTILLFFEAYIETTGGSGICYIDAFNETLTRFLQVEKIRLYDECEYGADLEVVDYALEWGDVTPGGARTGTIRLRNAGPPCSRLDWEIVSWPDWGTWTFDPRLGYDLTGRTGVMVINVTVQAPNQEETTFAGDITIANTNDASDTEILPVSLTTPLRQTSRLDMFDAQAQYADMVGEWRLHGLVRAMLMFLWEHVGHCSGHT
jgi:hypothetical protein